MSQHESIEVALFPIPGMVAFPGTTAPLHVFEPRYRAMINHCLDTGALLAVSHTRKALHANSSPKIKKIPVNSLDLNSNLQTYEAFEVFSAGNCELIETTEDGRMHVDIPFKHRLRQLEVIQQVPFKTVRCEIFEDAESLLAPQQLDDMLAGLQQLVLALSQKANPELHAVLMQDDWQNLSAKAFSFQLFTYFKFEPDFMQTVLEQDRVEDRLRLIWQGFSHSI
ncbi:LON peptidase substrate-binding domain-containing protein [Marinicella litoralis]|uniref:Lon N-terminal domain-containing protein n=1 Tax=Marinicella litoralis TaxID=644220 RepID=A0A4R6XI41_9GAMM|nr:LON peptidase substrate-binding domain-containing protein [Marinicella litoralis]TDR16813.1 hypothetical protein C8D91_2720 [Marinicella litoralis]